MLLQSGVHLLTDFFTKSLLFVTKYLIQYFRLFFLFFFSIFLSVLLIVVQEKILMIHLRGLQATIGHL